MAWRHLGHYRVTRRVRKRVPTEGGFTTVPDGIESFNVHIEVEPELLANQLGPKARHNRKGVTKLAHGAINAWVAFDSITHTPERT